MTTGLVELARLAVGRSSKPGDVEAFFEELGAFFGLGPATGPIVEMVEGMHPIAPPPDIAARVKTAIGDQPVRWGVGGGIVHQLGVTLAFEEAPAVVVEDPLLVVGGDLAEQILHRIGVFGLLCDAGHRLVDHPQPSVGIVALDDSLEPR